MALHSSSLAWKIPWTEEPGRLYSPWVVKSWVRLSDWTHSNVFRVHLCYRGIGTSFFLWLISGTPPQYPWLENPWTEEPGRLQSMGSLRVGDTIQIEQLHFHFSLSCIGEGNGNPLQCSCLESPRDGEAWWAAVCGVAQSRTRLKLLSSSSSSRASLRSIYVKLKNENWKTCPG